MRYKDYYQILSVGRDAPRDEIKRAYRKLARKYHPDVSKEPDAEARFKEINEAHAVLSDPEKRSAYDALGSGWHAGQEFRPPPGEGFYRRESHFAPEDAAQFSDFFSALFGGGFRRSPDDLFRQRGQDQSARLVISLKDAYQGAQRQIRLQVPQIGPRGQVTHGVRTLNVRIPPGVTDGQQIRLAGQGMPGLQGGPNGDLYLEVRFQPHPVYHATGRDIYVKLPIAPWEAALGATVNAPTLGGAVTLKVPPGSQSGQKLRLKGRGLPGSPPGNEYVILEIVVPPANTEEARRAYRRMAEEMPFDPRARLGVEP